MDVRNDNNNANQAGATAKGFVPFTLTYGGRSARQQAEAILAEVKRQHDNGAAKVGITYSANDQQTTSIIRAYNEEGKALTGVNGSNQAEVMAEVEKLMADGQQYASLQGVFQILPITTMLKDRGHVPNLVLEQHIRPGLDNIGQFLQNGGVVLGWKNENSTNDSPYAIGGGVSTRALNVNQKQEIQNYLHSKEQEYPAGLAAAPVAPPEANAQNKAQDAKAKEDAMHKAIAEAVREDFQKYYPDVTFQEVGKDAEAKGVEMSVDGWEKESGQYTISDENAKRRVVLDWNKDAKRARLLTDKPTIGDYHMVIDFLAKQGIGKLVLDYSTPREYDAKLSAEIIKRAIYEYDKDGKPVWQKDAQGKVMKDPNTGHPLHKWKEPPQAFRLGDVAWEAINKRTSTRNGIRNKIRENVLGKLLGFKSSTNPLDSNFGEKYGPTERHPDDVKVIELSELSQRRYQYWLDNKNIQLPENAATDPNAVAPPPPPAPPGQQPAAAQPAAAQPIPPAAVAQMPADNTLLAAGQASAEALRAMSQNTALNDDLKRAESDGILNADEVRVLRDISVALDSDQNIVPAPAAEKIEVRDILIKFIEDIRNDPTNKQEYAKAASEALDKVGDFGLNVMDAKREFDRSQQLDAGSGLRNK